MECALLLRPRRTSTKARYGSRTGKSLPEDVHTLRPLWPPRPSPDETSRAVRSWSSGCVWTSPPCRPVSASTRGCLACTWRQPEPARVCDLCRRLFACRRSKQNNLSPPHQPHVYTIDCARYLKMCVKLRWWRTEVLAPHMADSRAGMGCGRGSPPTMGVRAFGGKLHFVFAQIAILALAFGCKWFFKVV